MNKFTPYILFIAAIGIFTYSEILYEDKITSLKQSIYNLEHRVDSIEHVNDSLSIKLKKLQKFDIQYYKDGLDELINAIISVESSGRDSAYNKSEDAVGCLQIRQTMVNDVNRILKRKGSGLQYTLTDRWCRDKSIEMFTIYCDHYNFKTDEQIARSWNGGPRGYSNPATEKYWNKVETQLGETYAFK